MQYDLMELEEAKAEHHLRMQQIQQQLQTIPESQDSGLDMNQALMMLLAKAFMPQQGAVPVPPASPTTPPQAAPATVTFTDEQLRTVWNELPRAARKMAQNLDDDTVKNFIQAKLPGIDDDSLSRALRIVRS